jgi:gluconolactonase
MRALSGLTAALLLVPLMLPASGADKGTEKYPIFAKSKIVRKDPRFDKLFPEGNALEKLADGFLWVEGPVWVKSGGYLLFSDIPRNAIWKWHKGKGKSIFLQPSGLADRTKADKLREPGSNGLRLDPKGRLVACDHGNRMVWRMDLKTRKKTVLADRYEGKRFNSPNDLVFNKNGDLYFTDPPYGLLLKKGGDDDMPGREMDYCGVFRLTADGKLTLLTKEMSRPNGIALSPDEKTLYVANSDPKQAVWMAFPVKADGTLGKGKVFYDVTSWVGKQKPGLPDGMKVDRQGNLFATGPGGVLVFAPDATLLGLIETGVPTANCAFGDDGSTLYVAADKSLCRIRLSTKGKGF